MTSDRCYQAARSTDDAIAELRRNSGTQFDPAVIDALCRRLTLQPTPSLVLAGL
jgi:HD-GYP domain-containing protein (c-di-GMP phosphodiesterase class II)